MLPAVVLAISYHFSFGVCLVLKFTTSLSILSKLHAPDEAGKLWRGSTLLPGGCPG
jgi:hypothetical protein